MYDVRALIMRQGLIAPDVDSAAAAAVKNPVLAPYYTLTTISDRTLVFESRFESGNLAVAAKVSDNEYNLMMQNDINTQGHTQWFFFRVGNTTAGQSVRFNILNYVSLRNVNNDVG